MAEIRKIITAEQKRKKEAEEQEKRLGRIKVEELPSRGYSHARVDEIVARMKQRYELRGYGKKEGKGAELKRKVLGARALKLDQREAGELIHSKGFARLVGTLYSYFPFLNALTKRVSSYSIAKRIPYDLEKANMDYSANQYVSMAVVASIASGLVVALTTLALVLTTFSKPLADMAAKMSTTNGPLISSVVLEGISSSLVASAIQYFLAFALVFLITFVVSVMVLLITFQYPPSKAKQRGKAIDKELPFALRHMATEVKAGVGIHRTMKSIVEAGYGELSVEFNRTIREIEKGTSTSDALIEMSERAPSENLSRAVMHMVRTLNTGGNLSEIIETIAGEVSFELRMKMRDFVERLNLVGLFYMMVGIVGPVFIAILAGIFNAIPTIGLTGILGTQALFLIYFVLIPLALSLILYIIKVMQPM